MNISLDIVLNRFSVEEKVKDIVRRHILPQILLDGISEICWEPDLHSEESIFKTNTTIFNDCTVVIEDIPQIEFNLSAIVDYLNQLGYQVDVIYKSESQEGIAKLDLKLDERRLFTHSDIRDVINNCIGIYDGRVKSNACDLLPPEQKEISNRLYIPPYNLEANEREIYLTILNRFLKKEDLDKTYLGTIIFEIDLSDLGDKAKLVNSVLSKMNMEIQCSDVEGHYIISPACVKVGHRAHGDSILSYALYSVKRCYWNVSRAKAAVEEAAKEFLLLPYLSASSSKSHNPTQFIGPKGEKLYSIVENRREVSIKITETFNRTLVIHHNRAKDFLERDGIKVLTFKEQDGVRFLFPKPEEIQYGDLNDLSRDLKEQLSKVFTPDDPTDDHSETGDMARFMQLKNDPSTPDFIKSLYTPLKILHRCDVVETYNNLMDALINHVSISKHSAIDDSADVVVFSVKREYLEKDPEGMSTLLSLLNFCIYDFEDEEFYLLVRHTKY